MVRWVLCLFLYSSSFWAAVVCAAIGNAQDLPPGLKPCGAGSVQQALSGDRVLLTDGKIVQLADVKAPEVWPVGSAYKSWPASAQAQRALASLTVGKSVALFCHSMRQTYMGEAFAHMVTVEKGWVQDALLAGGHVWHMAEAPDARVFQRMADAESRARAQEVGLWALPDYKVVEAENIQAIKPGWFQFVRGKVKSVQHVKANIYLNFGDDWATDFTVRLPVRQMKNHPILKPDILAETLEREKMSAHPLVSKIVEVRGWVEWAGGPMIIPSGYHRLAIFPD